MSEAFRCQGKIASFLGAWILTILVFLTYVKESDTIVFFHFGPSKHVKFIDIAIDDWNKWYILMVFTIVTQTLKMLADEIISPWIINTIMDDKTDIQYLNYYKSQCICQTYYLFSAIVNFFQVSISITQIDFVSVYIITDIAISVFTTHMYLQSKTNEYKTLIDYSCHK